MGNHNESLGRHPKFTPKDDRHPTLVASHPDVPPVQRRPLRPADIGITLDLRRVDPGLLNNPTLAIKRGVDRRAENSHQIVTITPTTKKPFVSVFTSENSYKNQVCGGGTSKEALRRARRKIKRQNRARSERLSKAQVRFGAEFDISRFLRNRKNH